MKKNNIFNLELFIISLKLSFVLIVLVSITLSLFSSFLPLVILLLIFSLAITWYFKKSFDVIKKIENIDFGEKTLTKASTLDHKFNLILHYLDLKENSLLDENQKFQILLESITDHILAVDLHENVLFCNERFKKTFFPENQEHLSLKLWHLFDDKNFVQKFYNVIQSSEDMTLDDFEFSNQIYRVRLSALKNSRLELIGVLAVFYDLTELKRTDSMKVDFVANVSHEMRTPLTSIKGYCEILQEQKEKIDPSLHPFLNKILKNTQRMTLLFNDLLQLSLIESPTSLEMEQIDLEELIETVINHLKPHYPEKMITLDLTNIKTPFIHGNFKLFEQVFINLIDNAFKYSHNEPKLVIESEMDQTNCLITISDNGIGIPKESLERVFERFYRVETSRESIRGTGLGLSIVKHVIQKHGGKIWVEKINSGSRFKISIPLQDHTKTS